MAPQGDDDIVYGRNGTTFDTPEAVAAAETLVEMRDRGFFADGYDAMTRHDAYDRFVGDGAQFLATGSWTWPALKATGRPFLHRDAESANQLGHYLDWAFPTGPETFKAELARLLANEITPKQFVQNIDTAYQAYLATLR